MSDYVSSVELKADLAALFFREIGEKIDLNMFKKKNLDDKIDKLSMHKQVLDSMAAIGFERKGFTGYCPSKTKISKGQVKSFLDKTQNEQIKVKEAINKEFARLISKLDEQIALVENLAGKAKLGMVLDFKRSSELDAKLKELKREARKTDKDDKKYRSVIDNMRTIVERSTVSGLEKTLAILDNGIETIRHIVEEDSLSNDKLASAILSHLIPTEKEFKFCSAASSETTTNTFKKNTKELYAWQKAVIDMIKEERKSVVVRGPTNGGKTFVGLSVIEHFISSDSNFVFVLPTTYLAAQTYSNIINTFGVKYTVNLLAGSLFVQSATLPKIIVGTPEPIWAWLRSNPSFRIKRMIVDEIHTISSPGSNRGAAIRNIISKCEEQFLGLSATVHDDDLLLIREIIKEKIPNCEFLKYDERPNQLVNQRYTLSGIQTITERQIESQIPEITPRNTLKLLMQLKSENKLPCLIFDESDSASWNQFVEFNEYLAFLDSSVSPEWRSMWLEIDSQIERYNSTNSALYQEYCAAVNSGNQKVIDSMSKNFIMIRNERAAVLESSYSKCLHTAKAAAIKQLDERFDEYMIPVDDQLKKRLKSFSIKHGEKVYPGLVDLLKSLELLKETKDPDSFHKLDAISPLSSYFGGESPWLRFCDFAVTNNLTEMLRSDRKTDQREHMLKMCRAESIRESDIADLFKILEAGARYGIVSLLPSLPNVIQVEILKLFNSKSINVVFTSKDMSMGVNFPVVTSIVRCTSSRASLPTDARIQAEGRAGRTGKSNVGYSITWNIMNDHDKVFPRLEIPELDSTRGCYINNIDETMESLYTHYVCKKDISKHFDAIRDKLFRVVTGESRARKTEMELRELETRDSNDADQDFDLVEAGQGSAATQKRVEKVTATSSSSCSDEIQEIILQKNVNDIWKETCTDLIEKIEESLDNDSCKADAVAKFLCNSVIQNDLSDLAAARDLVKEIEVRDPVVAEKILRHAIDIVDDTDHETFSQALQEVVDSKTSILNNAELINTIMSAYETLQENEESRETISDRIVIYKMIEVVDTYINALQELINYSQSNVRKILVERDSIFGKMTVAEQKTAVGDFKKHLTEMFRGICQAKYRCMKHLS